MRNFKYALRHYHWAPDQPHVFASYEEHVTSVPTTVDGKKAATIFLNTDNAKTRALKFGWVDETEKVRVSLTPKVVSEPEPKPKRKYTKRKK